MGVFDYMVLLGTSGIMGILVLVLGLLLVEILILYPRLVQWSGGKISIFPSKEIQEMDQYTQGRCQEFQETVLGFRKRVTRHKEGIRECMN